MKKDQTYEVPYFGDLFFMSRYLYKTVDFELFLLGILFCLKKRALIFWVGHPSRTQNIMAYSPEYLGVEVDNEIPLLASYNGSHYQV